MFENIYFNLRVKLRATAAPILIRILEHYLVADCTGLKKIYWAEMKFQRMVKGCTQKGQIRCDVFKE